MVGKLRLQGYFSCYMPPDYAFVKKVFNKKKLPPLKTQEPFEVRKNSETRISLLLRGTYFWGISTFQRLQGRPQRGQL
jgi:hypothetical protein